MTYRWIVSGFLLLLTACSDDKAAKAPALFDRTVTTREDTPIAVEVSVTAQDTGAVALSVVVPPGHGAISGGGPTWMYAPAADFTGSDHFVVRGEDRFGSAMATITMNVTPVDDGPIANPDSFADAFNVVLSLPQMAVLANDTDVDGPALAVTQVVATTHGAPVLDGDHILFTPEDGFEGTATFEYTISDGTLSAHATVSVAIGADHAPVAVDDVETTPEDIALVLPDAALLVNDSDPDHQTLRIAAVGSASHGSVSHSGTQVAFVPDVDFHGVAGFEYTITDGFKTDVAAVVVTVSSVNDVPVAVSDSAATDEDTALTLTSAALVANDTDRDGDVLAVSAVTPTGNTHGSVSLDSGVVTYVPDADFNGAAEFSYTVSDGNGGSATALVEVTVNPVDDAPIAVNDSATVLEDSGATPIAVLANDTDVDGGPRSISAVTQPAHGAVEITGGGTGLTYAPSANYCNIRAPTLVPQAQIRDTFSYTLTPGGSTATVTMMVTCVDDPPVAVADAETVAEDSTANVFDVLPNDSDVDGGPKLVASVTQPAHGSAAVGPNGLSVLYAPAADYCNQGPNVPPDLFTYALAPGGSSTTVSVTVLCACGKTKPTDFVVGSN